jgi:hypothetical protein
MTETNCSKVPCSASSNLMAHPHKQHVVVAARFPVVFLSSTKLVVFMWLLHHIHALCMKHNDNHAQIRTSAQSNSDTLLDTLQLCPGFTHSGMSS